MRGSTRRPSSLGFSPMVSAPSVSGRERGSGIPVDTSIRALGRTIREPLVLDFATSHEQTLFDVVQAVRELYDGTPVGSPAIGERVGMLHNRTLVYLHEAHKAGLVQPAIVSGRIRGWMPPHVGATPKRPQDGPRETAKVVHDLYRGEPVLTRDVAERMGIHICTVNRRLKKATALGLVRRADGRHAWLPVEPADE